jgi:uncharacterized protein (DUF305 family)
MDLVTSIDRERKEAKERNFKRAIREKRKQQIEQMRAERGKWESKRSELISYAKMMCDYFKYVNSPENTLSSHYSSFDKVTRRMEQFCQDNNLQVKAIKEVHYLCL